MLLAPISAPQWAPKFQTGLYHMVIAPWVLSERRLAEHYTTALRPVGCTVTMDTGAWEGHRLDAATLHRAAVLCRADVVALPDVLGEAKPTLQKAWACWQQLKSKTFPIGIPDSPKTEQLFHVGPQEIMFIPQGRTPQELWKCIESWHRKWQGQDDLHTGLVIGLISYREGRNIDTDTWKPDTRARLVEALAPIAEAFGYRIHLLGMPNLQTFLTEELPIASQRMVVRGIDTSFPFTLGYAGKMVTPVAQKIPMLKPEDYFRVSPYQLRLIDLNIRILRRWVESTTFTPYIPIEVVRIAAAQYSNDRRVYLDPAFALATARVPTGQYAVQYLTSAKNVPLGVYPYYLVQGDVPPNCTIIEVRYD